MNYTLFSDVWESALKSESPEAFHNIWDKYGIATEDALDTIYAMAYGGPRGIRAALGFSQVSFAESYGLSRRTLEDWEAGRRLPPSYLVKLLGYAVLTDLEAIQHEFIPAPATPPKSR